MSTRVRVAVRCRPLVPKEKDQGCQSCVSVFSDNQVFLNKDKSFTFDYAFGSQSAQEDVFQDCGYPLIEAIFKGFNATMLAYGQTGSGKTYTMGSGKLTPECDHSTLGIIPRVVEALFRQMEDNSDSFEYTSTVSFLEIYNEELKDLLIKEKQTEQLGMRDEGSGIKVIGLTEKEVTSPQETLNLLCHGSDNRTVGATEMNAASSRSHAIFTISVEQRSKAETEDCWRSKFVLVDLAGSERAKRTGAQGDRFKEGVNINLGLFALGNVISALGDEKQKKGHIPYRDSKLTRLLQDSLGGNSYTMMIACISPADSNNEETLNTLRYADRAKKIKNKPKVNRDPQMAEILRLRTLVQQLQSGVVSGSSALPGTDNHNDPVTNLEAQKLREKHKLLEQQNEKLAVELANAIDHSNDLCEKVILAEMGKDKLKNVLAKITIETGVSLDELDSSLADPELKPEVRERLTKIRDIHTRIKSIEEDKSALEVTLSDINGNLSTIDEATDESANTVDTQTSTLTPGGSSVVTVLDRDSDPNDTAATPAPETDPDSYAKAYTLHRAKMSRQLKELNDMLASKEALVNNGSSAVQEVQVELEDKIKGLEQEIDKLRNQLSHNKSSSNAGKLAEQRRQRLKELEQQMADMKLKLRDHSRLVKSKEQVDKQCEKLNTEIVAMKQQRVKLMRQIKEEGDKFRKWKLEQDKMVMQLKAKDRKRQCEMAKMEMQHNKVQAFYKRKTEEATQANKRLKDALDKRVSASRQKATSLANCRTNLNSGNRVKLLISEELDLQVSIKDAERSLQDQISSRTDLTRELSAVKKQLLRKLTRDTRKEMEEKVPYIEAQICMCNAQIAEFNQKLSDVRSAKSQSISEHVTSMPECRIAIKSLLAMAVQAKTEVLMFESKDKDTTLSLDQANHKMDSLEKELTEMEEYHQSEMEVMKKDYDRKMAAMKRNLERNGLSTSDLNINSMQLDITELHGQLEEKDRNITDLKKKIEVIQNMSNTTFVLTPTKVHNSTLPNVGERFPNLGIEPSPLVEKTKVMTKVRNGTDHPVAVSVSAKQSGNKVKVTNKIQPIPEDDPMDIFSEISEDEFEDDDPADLSWKATPEIKRMRRVSSFSKCTCNKTNCSQGNCGCRRNKRPCGPLCGCIISQCCNSYTHPGNDNLNKAKTTSVGDEMDTSDGSNTALNTTYTQSPEKLDLDSSPEENYEHKSNKDDKKKMKRNDSSSSMGGKRRKLLSLSTNKLDLDSPLQ